MEEPSTSPTNKRQKTQISFVTPNPFAPLSTRDCDNSSAPAEEPKKLPPSIPPIFIKNVVNMNTLLNDLKGLDPGPFKHKTVNNEVKFNFETLEGYRTFINYLIKNSAEYHTFQLKTERSFRVVIRGLHPSCDVPSMMEELRSLGYDPVQMLPVRHPVTKMSLPIFFVDLRPNTKNIEIYNLTRLYHAVVRVEPPKPRRTVIQCVRCQEYGHSKNYCNRAPRCVKCEGKHSTADCTKSAASPPICVNCSGSHTANYKGCPVHKQLQQATGLTRTLHTKPQHTTPTNQQAHPNQNRSHTPNNSTHPSYADITKQPQPTIHNTSDPKFENNLISKIDSLLSLLQPLIGMLTQLLPVLLNK
jgi:hypothetical protein